MEFNGVKLAASSSRGSNKTRWVEFELYRTPKGQYVLSRIGMSVYYHSEDCQTVTRNRLSAVDGATLSSIYVPCETCNPKRLSVDGVFPETPRYTAYVCADAIGLVDSLRRQDHNGTEYITNVARRLLTDASEQDEDIAYAFLVDHID